MKRNQSRKRRLKQLKRQMGYSRALSELGREVGSISVTKIPFVQTSKFLNTPAWRKIRMAALVKYGARCQCCGASRKDGIKINVDHIKPRKTHPELALEFDNLQVLCEPCNHGKGNLDTTDWR